MSARDVNAKLRLELRNISFWNSGRASAVSICSSTAREKVLRRDEYAVPVSNCASCGGLLWALPSGNAEAQTPLHPLRPARSAVPITTTAPEQCSSQAGRAMPASLRVVAEKPWWCLTKRPGEVAGAKSYHRESVFQLGLGPWQTFSARGIPPACC